MGMKVINRVQQGDIIYASCVGHTLCHHIGIVYRTDDKLKVFHNSPYIKNKYGGSICSETYDEFMKGRLAVKIVRTNVSNQRILEIARKHKDEVWDELFFNCEDFVLEVTEGHRRSNIRDAWKIAALGVTLISMY